MRPAGLLVAAAPLAAALAALVAVFLAGFDGRAALPLELETRFYGFYLDRYPLFAFAIVYGLARVLAAGLAPGPSGPVRRALGVALGTLALTGLSLHPTFGGYALRAAFATGGMAFLNQTPMPAAYLTGAGAAAVIFGAAMGLGAAVAGRVRRVRAGFWHGLARGLFALLASLLALWYAFALLGLARPAGLGPWPHRPLDAGDALLAAACLTLAFLPHVLLVAGRSARAP